MGFWVAAAAAAAAGELAMTAEVFDGGRVGG